MDFQIIHFSALFPPEADLQPPEAEEVSSAIASSRYPYEINYLKVHNPVTDDPPSETSDDTLHLAGVILAVG